MLDFWILFCWPPCENKFLFLIKIKESQYITFFMVSEESAELRALRTFVPYVSRTPRALCLTCSRALRASYLVTHMPRALRFSFSAGLVSYVLSCPTCLVSYVLSWDSASTLGCPCASHIYFFGRKRKDFVKDSMSKRKKICFIYFASLIIKWIIMKYK